MQFITILARTLSECGSWSCLSLGLAGLGIAAGGLGIGAGGAILVAIAGGFALIGAALAAGREGARSRG